MDIYAQNGVTPLSLLKTARLELRPVALSDAEAIVEKLNDFEVSKWLTVVPYPYTRDDALWFIEENLIGRAESWSVYEGDTLIGNVGGGSEIGYWLVPEVWGRGYATEIGQLVVDYLFSDPVRNDLASAHFVDNIGSQKVLEKLGFVDVGGHVHHSVARGEDVAGRMMLLTRDCWTKLRDA